MEWVSDLSEWLGFRPPSLHVKSCSAVAGVHEILTSLIKFFHLNMEIH